MSPDFSRNTPGQELSGFRVAALVEDRFEQIELTSPKQALEQAGARVDIISRHAEMTAVEHDQPGARFHAQVALSQARAEAYDALLLPGGVANGDRLRMVGEAQAFAREMVRQDKPVAVICHGGWLLISAGLVRGRTITSWPTLQDDYRNAGAHWVDQPVVVEGNWVSSRKPADLEEFNAAMLALFARVQARSQVRAGERRAA